MVKQLFQMGVQFLFSSYLFNAPGFSNLKSFVYKIVFNQKHLFLVREHTYFIASHIKEGGNGTFKIGKNVLIKHRCDIDFSGGVTIEDDVNIAQDVYISTHSHNFKNKSLESQKKIAFSPLLIKKNAVIGAGVKILSSVNVIGEGAIISANSVVVNDVADYTVVMGNPARAIYSRKDEE
jgi:acetyltransferase-like isoleucine patch superfamily enzyme